MFIVLIALIAPGIAVFIPSPQSDSTTDDVVEINVMAAASLSRAFNDVAAAFSQANANISVKLSFAGSSTLATQIQAGAPMDVVAMADQVNMQKLASEELVAVSSLQTFAKNRLAIITAKDNPRGITSINDLTQSDLTVVLCDLSQPCGRYADDMFTRAGLLISPASRESSVSGVMSRIRNGEADAGIAYVSDAVADASISAVQIPDASNVVADYPIAIASQQSSQNLRASQLFVNFIMSSVGQNILKTTGFIQVGSS
jgi:molybdate transport system substrate-binding protein